jgi:thiamine biosynthesis protein ThiI
MTSTDLNRELGAFIQAQTGWRVDLTRPELNVRVEVLPGETFVYTAKLPGPGGLPVGVSGRVAALMSGGIDSPVSAWRMMKRGCRVVFVHFHSVPYLSAASKEKAMALARHLTRYQYDSRLYMVPFGEIQREIVLAAPPPLRVVLYRRLMVRIAERIALKERCQALVTGESVGQVASQTLENLARLNEVATLPILRPLIGMDKEEISAQARAIGSFEISIEPDQDCCQLFVAKHPSTRTTPEQVEKAEVSLDIEGLVARGVAEAEWKEYQFPETH